MPDFFIPVTLKKIVLPFTLFLLLLNLCAKAQYISTSETEPYSCPSICAGSPLVLKIFQIQNLTVGAQVQAVLSNPSGGFASGTTFIPCNRYSLSSPNGPWTNGPFLFSNNLNNVYFEIVIPTNTTPSAAYNIYFRSGITQGAVMQMPCTGFTISQSYTPLAPVPSNTMLSNQWIAHAYTWTATTSSPLTTPSLIAQQSFFALPNYKGHFLKNALNFDLNFSGAGGGKMPGPVGIINDGTSFTCGQGYATNYSLRLYRTENFAPGFYRFTLGADDGARLSIDGGVTWILDMFTEHSYSLINTNSSYPNGVCLSGNTQLVIEYFQRPVDARVTFAATPLTPAITAPLNQIICESDNASFTVGQALAFANYQWEVSTDGGQTFTAIQANQNPYLGSQSSTLQLSNVPLSFSNYQYRCGIVGTCGSTYLSDTASIQVNASIAISTQPNNETACSNDTVTFSVQANNAVSYQWQVNNGSGFTNITNGNLYSGASTASLNVNGVSAAINNYQYQCIVNGCGPAQTSNVVGLFLAQPNITLQPEDQEFCGSQKIFLELNANGASIFQWQISTDAGISFNSLPNDNVYSNTSGPRLEINAGSQLNGFYFQCLVGGCGSLIASQKVKLIVQGNSLLDSIPNVFTPNGDSQNEFFELKDLGFNSANGGIYNRWGEEVFRFNSAQDKWDGTIKGKQASDGVYFYYLEIIGNCSQEKVTKRGAITLLR